MGGDREPVLPAGTDLTGKLPMDLVAGWSMEGLWIEFGDIGLHVHSGADTTYISDAPERPCDQGHTRVTHRQLQEDDAQAS